MFQAKGEFGSFCDKRGLHDQKEPGKRCSCGFVHPITQKQVDARDVSVYQSYVHVDHVHEFGKFQDCY